MPSWKKVVASGSDASFSSLTVDTFVSASSFNGTFTGSLNGTASQAISSSFALTASYALNGGSGQGFPFSGSAQITGSLGVTGSFSVNGNTGQTVFSSDADTLVISGSLIVTGSTSLTGSLSVRGGITGSLYGTSSWAENSISSSYALTASYALNGGGGGVSAIYILDEGVVQGTASYFDFTGAGVTATVNAGTASIYIPGGGGGSNTNSQNAILSQTSPAMTWSFTHNLSTLYPVFTIYDNEDNVIIPQRIYAATTSSAFIYFSSARTGTAVASKGGDVTSASFAATASLAYFAISASQAATASSANTFVVRNDITASSALITGTLTAQTLVVQTVTSSIIYSSGSNIFGSELTDQQTFTGSVNITGSLTVDGLKYPTADNGEFSFMQTDGAGNLSLQYVNTTNDTVYNGEATQLLRGTPVFVSGSVGANPKVFRADASDPAKMPVTYIIGDNIDSASTGRAIILGQIDAVNTTGYAEGSLIYVAEGGGWTSSRPTGASSIVQPLGIVTKEGSGGKGLVLNPGPVLLPNLAAGKIWIGDANNQPVEAFTSSINTVISSSYSYTASSAINASASLISVSSSYALTASYALNGGGGGLSALFIADEGITQGTASYINFTGAGVTATVSAGTASINITGGGSTGTSGLSTTFTQSVAATEWTFVHNLNTRYPLIQVYDTTFNQVTPQYVSSSTADTVIIGFGIATAGYAVASNGGTLYVTGSNVILDQAVAAATWSFNHNLNTQYPIFQVFDSENEVIIPERIVATDATSSLFYFPSPVAGKAVASVGGISGSMGSGVGFPFSGSAVITGSFLVSQSFVDFSNTTGVTGSFSGSLFGTASYATFALSASFAPGFTTNMSQSVAATTWSFTHNLNTINPIVQVYDLTNSQIIPNQIVGMNNSTAEIRFDYAQAGYAVASNGGGLYVTGSTSTLVQTSANVTWSFTHNLNNKYNTYEVYDDSDLVIIPSGIKALTNNTAELYFAGPQTGRAVAQFSGINGSPNATSASYATTAATASYLNPITDSFVVLTQVSQSLNFVDDTAAAAGGVPLGGLYRNGNFILIRLS
jgi:transcriptional regulator GlxA family with amidase domain